MYILQEGNWYSLRTRASALRLSSSSVRKIGQLAFSWGSSELMTNLRLHSKRYALQLLCGLDPESLLSPRRLPIDASSDYAEVYGIERLQRLLKLEAEVQ